MTTAPSHRVFAPTAQFPPRPVLGITVPGWPIIGLFLVISALASAAALAWLGNWGWIIAGICGALTLWCIWFFRDPPRRAPAEADLIISPADGVVCQILRTNPPPEIFPASDAPPLRISVFMNVFNVHVNRSPAAGTIEKLAYHPGKFFNASFDKASEFNERLSMLLRMPDGAQLVCVQIAGLIARRIVCQVREGTAVGRGDRYGLIRFGSRVDVYLPPGYEPVVTVGQPMVAGETVLARLGEPLLAGVGSDGRDQLSAGASRPGSGSDPRTAPNPGKE